MDSSRFLPRNREMKKFTMDLAAPESRMEQAMIEPKMMVIPMLPRVEPKPLAMVVMVTSGLLPRMEPASMPPANSAMTGWTFSFTIRTISTTMEMTIAKTNCVMIEVPPKLLTWPRWKLRGRAAHGPAAGPFPERRKGRPGARASRAVHGARPLKACRPRLPQDQLPGTKDLSFCLPS